MKKANSQLKKEVSPEIAKQRALRRKFSYLKNYYGKQIGLRTMQIMESGNVNNKTKNYISSVASEMNFVVEQMFQQRLETEEYIQCIEGRYKDIMYFFKQFAKYDYNAYWMRDELGGGYGGFLPSDEEFNIGSQKIYEKIFDNINEFYNECEVYRK